MPCSNLPCKDNGKCVTIYKTNSYVCVKKKKFTGKHCEIGKDLERTTKVVLVSAAVVTVVLVVVAAAEQQQQQQQEQQQQQQQ